MSDPRQPGPAGLQPQEWGRTVRGFHVGGIMAPEPQAGMSLVDSTMLLAADVEHEDELQKTDVAAPVAILRVLVAGTSPQDIVLTAGDLTIGRGPDQQLQLVHASVSRRHMCLHVMPGHLVAVDLGSSRGTFVDGVRISKPTPVSIGSTIAVGEQRLEIHPIARAATAIAPMGATQVSKPQTMAGGPVSAPTPQDLQQVVQTSVLVDVDESDRASLVAAMHVVDLAPGQVLLAPDQELSYLNVVLAGQLVLYGRSHSTGNVSIGEAVDLLGVLHGARSSFEVRAGDEPVRIARIDAKALRAAVARDPKLSRYIEHPLLWPGAARFRQHLRDFGIPRDCAIDLVAALTSRPCPAGTQLAAEGARIDQLRIISRGTVAGSKTVEGVATTVTQLGDGSLFGAAELAGDKGYALSYSAVTDVEILEVDRQVVVGMLHRAPQLATMLDAFAVFGQRAPEPEPVDDGPAEPEDDDRDAPPVKTFSKKGGIKPLRRPKPRFVRQHDEMDCGAACLAMVSMAYGRKISLATYRSRVHVTREGASMWSLVRAARQTGFEVTGVHCSPRAMAELQLPAIMLAQYHFMVVYAVGKTHVLVGDPAIGLRRVPMDEFKKEFSGMLLLLRPTQKFFEQPNSRPGWRKYLALAPGHIWPAFEIVLASLLQFLFGLGSPLLTQVAFDRVLVTRDTGLLSILVIAMATVSLLSIVMGSVTGYLTGYIANRFDTVFSALVYRFVMRLPMNFFMVRRVGDILTRFTEIQNIRQFLTGDALNSLVQVGSIAIYIAVLFLFDTTIGTLALVLTPVVAITSVACSRRLRKLMQEAFPPSAKAQGLIVEQMRSLETVKALGAEVAGRWRWEEAFREALRSRLRVDKLRVLINVASEGTEQLALVAILYLSARMAISGELSIGKVIATGMLASQVFTPVQALATQWTKLQTVAVGFGRIDDVITTKAEPSASSDPAAAGARRRLQGDIELRNVWFQYGSDLSPWVLKDINLTIKRGETVALVGRSGSGKTTLVQMLNLLYRPTRGTILIDGKDVSTLPLGQLRDSIGMVMQDSHLFAGSVFDNIAFGQEDASLELVMAAARVANAQGFISTMKDGYFSKLKEGGSGLSGGQRQRLNLARALFRRPTILALDEATSALDSESERAIVEAMKVYCRGRTSILIAHRLSTVLHADRIVLLDKGRIVEVGSHRELIARGGAYVQLFGAQLAL